jgi:hypothetical protein
MSLQAPSDAWFQQEARCVQLGGGKRHGTIVSGFWSGYVDVRWDSGRVEQTHIRDIKPE